MHHPLGLALAVFGHQTRHDCRVAGAHCRGGHIAEQQAVTVVEREPAVVGLFVTGAELAVVQRVTAGHAFFGVHLMAMLHGGHVVVVHGAYVMAVQPVFILQLPVAVVGVGRLAWQHFQLTGRLLRDHHVKEHLSVAQVILKVVGAVDVETDVDKALVTLDPALLQAAGGLVETFGIFTWCFDLDQATVTFVAPCVEPARERRLVTFTNSGQGGAAMLVGIDQGIEFAFAVASNDHRLASSAHGHEVMIVGDFAFVAAVDPVLFEDEFHFEIEQVGFGEYRTVDAIHAFGRAKIQAAFDEVLPLRDGFRALRGPLS